MSREPTNSKRQINKDSEKRIAIVLAVFLAVGFGGVFAWDTWTYGPIWSPDREKRADEVDATKWTIPEKLAKVTSENFQDNGDGSVTDTTTGLIWQKEAWGPIKNIDEADSHFRNLRVGGAGDWRLPTREELADLYRTLGSAVPDSADHRVRPFSWPGHNYLASGRVLIFGHALNFATGKSFYLRTSSPYRMYVRAVRFTAPATAKDDTDKTKDFQKTVYVDPKGYFRISPPSGWRIQEYQEDPRGKVAFIAPGTPTDLRVLAKAVDISDYDGLLKNLQDVEKQSSVPMNIEPVVFNRMPAVKRVATMTAQGVTLKVLWIDLLIGGVSHNLQYAAPPNFFAKYYETAWQSMLTYQPLKQEKGSSPEEVRKHEVARWVRLAKISLEMDKTQAARDAVAAGLEVDPTNRDLKQLKSQLDK
ncbi:MAG: DUF1566 domain-containing protein [Deltaproteobacteria bacterium]|nr:DUF1566 domain-containing protein [Deltaproteobacteria bacterium]